MVPVTMWLCGPLNSSSPTVSPSGASQSTLNLTGISNRGTTCSGLTVPPDTEETCFFPSSLAQLVAKGNDLNPPAALRGFRLMFKSLQ